MTPILTIRELLDLEFPEQKWIVDKLVPASALTLYTGAQASYKSWSLLHMALCVAEGEPVFGHFKTEKVGVLIVDNEDKLWQFQDRLNKLGASSNMSVYFSKDRNFDIKDNDKVKRLLRECIARDIKVVVMDSLRRIHDGDENSSKEMSAVFRQIDKFIDKGIAVIATQHMRKEGKGNYGISQAVRGSSDIMAAPDSHLSVKRRGRQLTIHQTKQRFAEEIRPFEVEVRGIESDSLTFEYVGNLELDEDAGDNDLKVEIANVLAEYSQLNQQDLLAKLTENKTEIGEHKLRDLLNAMIRDGDVNYKKGKRREKLYFLVSGSDTEEDKNA